MFPVVDFPAARGCAARTTAASPLNSQGGRPVDRLLGGGLSGLFFAGEYEASQLCSAGLSRASLDHRTKCVLTDRTDFRAAAFLVTSGFPATRDVWLVVSGGDPDCCGLVFAD